MPMMIRLVKKMILKMRFKSAVLPPLPQLIQHVRKLDNDATAFPLKMLVGDADPDAHDENIEQR